MKDNLVEIEVEVPSWLATLADKANINYSQVLQDALMQQLHLNQREAGQ